MNGNKRILEFWRGKWCLISICIEVPKYIYIPHYDMGVLIIVGNIIMFLRVIISWQGRRSTDGYYPYRCSTWTRVSAGVCECVYVCGWEVHQISTYLSIFPSFYLKIPIPNECVSIAVTPAIQSYDICIIAIQMDTHICRHSNMYVWKIFLENRFILKLRFHTLIVHFLTLRTSVITNNWE